MDADARLWAVTTAAWLATTRPDTSTGSSESLEPPAEMGFLDGKRAR